MVQTTRQSTKPEHAAAVRALRSLTNRDAAAVRAAIRSAGDRFAVEEHDDYDGYRSFLLTSLHDNETGFLVSGRGGAIDLAELQGDEMTALGRYSNIADAMLALHPALGRNRPASAGDDER